MWIGWFGHGSYSITEIDNVGFLRRGVVAVHQGTRGLWLFGHWGHFIVEVDDVGFFVRCVAAGHGGGRCLCLWLCVNIDLVDGVVRDGSTDESIWVVQVQMQGNLEQIEPVYIM